MMKELYFTSPYRRSTRTVRLESGQVKKAFILRTFEGGINGRGTSENPPNEQVFENEQELLKKLYETKSNGNRFSWMIACLCRAMSLDQDEETIYADFNADAYNDLIEYQFSNIVKLMSGLEMSDSIQEKVLKELSTNLASLMVVEN